MLTWYAADLSLDARLLYVSTSITDILGYLPHEVVGKSCWEYFHPDEIPFARAIHGRGVQLDKAAVLNYCQIKNRDGRWVGCECVFTIVHDVLVASTSIYKTGASSQSRCHHHSVLESSTLKFLTERAADAPVIRQLFSSSPKDPRYHMLSYISHKFEQEIKPQTHEPRAALFLNRFTRTLTIVYATNGLANLLGVPADELCGKSFYYCIQENCLKDAVKCLESAKANDSIAYLRFWFRDPRQQDQTQDEDMDVYSSGEDEEGGVHLDDPMDEAVSEHAVPSDSAASQAGSAAGEEPTEISSWERHSHRLSAHDAMLDPNSRSSSGNVTDHYSGDNDAIFDQPATRQSSISSLDFSTPDERQHLPPSATSPGPSQIELEAVVSCTSDGLVVVLRRARALVPQVAQPTTAPVRRSYQNGFFASPWAIDPMLPNMEQRRCDQPDQYLPGLTPLRPTMAQADTAAMRGPDQEDFMNSIREVAVFAWSLTGINGSLVRYGRGRPMGESLPPNGLPVWKPDSHTLAEEARHPYHGNDPQETRHHPRPPEQSGTPHDGFNNKLIDDHSNAFGSPSYNQPCCVYGNGNSSPSSNKASDAYNHNYEHNLYSTPSNGTHGSSYTSYNSGPIDVIHKPPNNEIHDGMHTEKTVNGTASPWGADNLGYNSDPREYGHDDATNRTGTNAYLDGNTNDYGSYGDNGATAGDAPPWLSPSHPAHHWDGLMPGPTSSHGHGQ